MCKKKKKEENERWEKKVARARRECEVWEIVNRESRKRRRMEKRIEEKEWKEYFMRLLGGIESKVVRGEGGRNWVNVEEEDLSRKEIGKAIQRLRDRKATRIDNVPGEV